jgi:hypothetical protein
VPASRLPNANAHPFVVPPLGGPACVFQVGPLVVPPLGGPACVFQVGPFVVPPLGGPAVRSSAFRRSLRVTGCLILAFQKSAL